MADPLDYLDNRRRPQARDAIGAAQRTFAPRSLIPAARFGSFGAFAAADDRAQRPRGGFQYGTRSFSRSIDPEQAAMDRVNRLQRIATFGYDRDVNVQNRAIAASIERSRNFVPVTRQLPGGGSVTVLSAPEKAPRFQSLEAARATGFYGGPPPGFTPTTPFERSYALGFTGGREGGGVTAPAPDIGLRELYQAGRSGLRSFIPAAASFVASMFRNPTVAETAPRSYYPYGQ